MALSDSARVIFAEFFDDTALHINCANATPVEIDRLHMVLTREFVGNQPHLVGNICRVAYMWPIGDDSVTTYHPTRTGWSNRRTPGLLMNAVEWVVALGLVAGLAAFVFWELGAFRR